MNLSTEASWRHEGEDPDYRFSLANERTFLAWMRTTLALIAGSVASVQFAPDFRIPGGRLILAVYLAGLSVYTGSTAYHRWRANEYAMRTSRSLPRSSAPATLTIAMAVLALFVLVLALTGHQ